MQRLVGEAPPLVQHATGLPALPPTSPEAAPVQRIFATPAPAHAQPPVPLPVAVPPAVPPTPEPAPVVARVAEPESSPSPPAQRAEAEAEAEAEPEKPAPQPQAQNPEELLRKLYDPLLRRLKADLWLDRERRGALTDL
ncbi:hypothetical protein [Lentzea aerocolonigenes]|uniref:hypothetical protein n=1 Tax=Lentzea aerocolonigenes TaxID=68170 RepID=UPI0012E1E3B5|nr:hypothetical protein [Lentzea aerocolonigenes]